MPKGKPSQTPTPGTGMESFFTEALLGNIDIKAVEQEFNQMLGELQTRANDPLGISAHPNPTAAERRAVMALAEESGRPPKLCRRALIKAGQDLAGAKKLLNDRDFCRRYIEFDPGVMSKLRNPHQAQEYHLRQEALYLGLTEQEIAPKLAKLQQQAQRYEQKKQKLKAQGGPKNTLTDPVLGNLKWREFTWEGAIDVPAFGGMSLTVETDTDNNFRKLPDDKQRNALKKFLAGASKIHDAVEQANFKYLQRVRKNYEESGIPVPKVSSADKLWKQLSDPAMTIPPQRGRSWKIELTWNCSWDEEHGHAVYIRDGKVVKVGIQGEGW